MLELALVENIQRKDLTAFEEAEALHSLGAKCGYTHEDLAKRLGKSRTSITESLSLNDHPARGQEGLPPGRTSPVSRSSFRWSAKAIRRRCWRSSRRSPRRACTREQLRKEQDKPKPGPGRPKAFVFSFRPPSKAFNLRLSFSKKNASKDEVISALEAILDDLRQQE